MRGMPPPVRTSDNRRRRSERFKNCYATIRDRDYISEGSLSEVGTTSSYNLDTLHGLVACNTYTHTQTQEEKKVTAPKFILQFVPVSV